MLHEYFRAAQDRYGVRGKVLAEAVGISTKHLSTFRQGKANMGVDTFWSLIEHLEGLAPGSQRYFGTLIAGKILSLSVQEMNDEELSLLLLEIAYEIQARKIGKKAVAKVPATV